MRLVMPCRAVGAGVARLLDVSVIDLPLHFAVVLIAAEPHFEHRREVGVLVDGDDVAALRAGNQM